MGLKGFIDYAVGSEKDTELRQEDCDHEWTDGRLEKFHPNVFVGNVHPQPYILHEDNGEFYTLQRVLKKRVCNQCGKTDTKSVESKRIYFQIDRVESRSDNQDQ